MGTGDVARPADDRVDPRRLIETGLGAVAHRRQRGFAGDPGHQSSDRSIRGKRQRGVAGNRLPARPEALRLQAFERLANRFEQGCRRSAGDGTGLDLDDAALRDDIHGVAAADRADLDGGTGGLENGIERAPTQFCRRAFCGRDHPRHRIDGVEAEIGAGGMARAALNLDARGGLALMGEDRPKAARLADDGRHGEGAERRQRFEEMRNAAATGLLVIGEGEMDRSGGLQGNERPDDRERRREKALHVARAAAEQLVAVQAQLERISAP